MQARRFDRDTIPIFEQGITKGKIHFAVRLWRVPRDSRTEDMPGDLSLGHDITRQADGKVHRILWW